MIWLRPIYIPKIKVFKLGMKFKTSISNVPGVVKERDWIEGLEEEGEQKYREGKIAIEEVLSVEAILDR